MVYFGLQLASFLFCFVLYFETGSLCVTALAVLELTLSGQAGLELTKICLFLGPKAYATTAWQGLPSTRPLHGCLG